MQISFARRSSEKKGKLRDIDLPCVLGSCVFRFSSLLLSNDPDLITDIETGCDSEEAPEKWELGCWLPLRVGGREPQACLDLISSGRGRKTTQQNSCPGENPTLCLHTTHPHAVMLPFPMKMKVEGEAHPGFPEPWMGRSTETVRPVRGMDKLSNQDLSSPPLLLFLEGA